MNRRQNPTLRAALLVALAAALALHATAQASPGATGAGSPSPPRVPRSAPFEESVTSYGAPLEIAAAVLADRYATVVTYEDPILRWRGDMVLRAEPGSDFVPYLPTQKPVRIPTELTPDRTTTLDTVAIGRLLDAYEAASPDAPHFRVVASHFGLHILPTEARDGNGNWAPAITPLDAVISVPEESRMAGQHLSEIIGAAEKASGVRLELDQGRGIDGVYAANGLLLPLGTGVRPLSPGDLAAAIPGVWLPPSSTPAPATPQVPMDPYMFRWGASNVPARDALISLLENSATTLRWDLGCEPNPVLAKTLCRVAVRPIQVKVSGPDGVTRMRQLLYDRCTKCPPLPPVPPTRPQQVKGQNR